MSTDILLWVGFTLFVLAMLALDLGVFHRKSHAVSLREALTWSAVWIALSLLLNLAIYFWRGEEVALQFLSGYLIEKSLSMDNIFIFLLIFTYFSVPSQYQHKVLFWGVLGALVMRALLIALGATLIERFHWIIYIFGAFLMLTGIQLATQKETEIHPEKNPVLRLFRQFVPVTTEYHGDTFFAKREGRRFATPLMLVLLIVETTDLIFAVDSIPAIFAVTTDAFIVYTSNVMAILGLRSLYFALAGIMGLFHYLRYGLAVILAFVGIKMVLADVYPIPTVVALGFIASVLLVSILLSIARPRKEATAARPTKPEAEDI